MQVAKPARLTPCLARLYFAVKTVVMTVGGITLSSLENYDIRGQDSLAFELVGFVMQVMPKLSDTA